MRCSRFTDCPCVRRSWYIEASTLRTGFQPVRDSFISDSIAHRVEAESRSMGRSPPFHRSVLSTRCTSQSRRSYKRVGMSSAADIVKRSASPAFSPRREDARRITLPVTCASLASRLRQCIAKLRPLLVGGHFYLPKQSAKLCGICHGEARNGGTFAERSGISVSRSTRTWIGTCPCLEGSVTATRGAATCALPARERHFSISMTALTVPSSPISSRRSRGCGTPTDRNFPPWSGFLWMRTRRYCRYRLQIWRSFLAWSNSMRSVLSLSWLDIAAWSRSCGQSV